MGKHFTFRIEAKTPQFPDANRVMLKEVKNKLSLCYFQLNMSLPTFLVVVADFKHECVAYYADDALLFMDLVPEIRGNNCNT